MSALSNADKTFIVETLLLWIYYYRLEQPLASKVQSVILLEEAHHLLRNTKSEEETIMDVTLREIRSLGIGVVIIDQMPSLMSKVALANTYATACLNLKLGDDKEKIGKCMGLNPEQKQALGDLPVGAAVFKMQDRFTKPFILKVPLVNVHRVPRNRIPHSRYARQPSTAAAPVEAVPVELQGRVPRVPPQENTPDQQEHEPKLKLELKLLADIAEQPVSTVVERYQRLGISRRKGNLAKQYLTREEWIEEQIISGKNGAWIKLLKPTSEGEKRLKELGIQVEHGTRHGGLEHKYWAHQIKKHLEEFLGESYQVVAEHPIGNGKTIDIAVVRNNELVIAVEVETGKSDHLANIAKAKHAGAKKIMAAFTTKSALVVL